MARSAAGSDCIERAQTTSCETKPQEVGCFHWKRQSEWCSANKQAVSTTRTMACLGVVISDLSSKHALCFYYEIAFPIFHPFPTCHGMYLHVVPITLPIAECDTREPRRE
ncbi:hypothetical protein BaRGS_00012712 [Batillaria attramentaria]|uniref:Uncharacterized protein n=1 Tax=Batillaria attramentaria TaxID=370345 RepID=A0ABD0L9P3_9CAEN